METPLDKAGLRRKMRQSRMEMPMSEHDRKVRGIVRHLLGAPIWDGVGNVHCFLALERAKEPDLSEAMDLLHAKGVRFAVPMAELPAPTMSHLEFVPGETTVPDPWGVPVPASKRPADTARIDLILVPMLAVDRGGFRLGYGKGYYDAFLAKTDALKVGVCFSEEVVDAVPRESHDQPVDWVVTDAGVWQTRR